MKKYLFISIIMAIALIGCAGSDVKQDTEEIDFNKPHLTIKLTYNFDVYEKPAFFLPKSYPTYAIWLEDKTIGEMHTVYVTGKAAANDWVMADSRPESLPVWYGVRQSSGAAEKVDAYSGATQSGETAVIHWPLPQGLLNKKVDVYIEANNSFDFNEHHHKRKGEPGYSGSNGQPSVIWQTELDFSKGTIEDIAPEIIGHGNVFGKDHKIHPNVATLTTAKETFQYIGISYFKD